MAHSFQVNGKRFRCVIDLHDATLDSDMNMMVAQFTTLRDLLVDRPGPLRKRGQISRTNTNAIASSGGASIIPWTSSTLYGGLTYAPYYSIGSSGNFVGVGDDSSAATTLRAHGTEQIRVGPPFMLGNRLYCMTAATPDPTSLRSLNMWSGTVHAQVSAGTATFTAASTTVTLSSALVSANRTACVGSFIQNTSEASTARSVYRIRSISADGLTITLDAAYNGTAAGAGKSYVITSNAIATTNAPQLMNGGATTITARAATAAWSRLVVATGTQQDSSGNYVLDNRRLAWSGIVNSAEGTAGAIGTAPWLGTQGFNVNGYLDIDNGQGEIRALVNLRNALIVFCDLGIVVVYGSPTVTGAGSLNTTTFYPGATCDPAGWGYATNGDTVWFVDPQRGLFRVDASGPPQNLSDTRFTDYLVANQQTAWRLAYYNGRLFGVNALTSGVGGYYSRAMFVFNVLRGEFITCSPSPYLWDLGVGRKPGASTQNQLIGVSSTTTTAGTSMYVVDVGSTIDAANTAANDWDGTAITFDIRTGRVGSPIGLVRPDLMYVTYKMTDLGGVNPALTGSVRTGYADSSSGSAHFFDLANAVLTKTTDIETRVVPVSVDRGQTIDVRLTGGNACNVFELHSVIVEGEFEGEGASN